MGDSYLGTRSEIYGQLHTQETVPAILLIMDVSSQKQLRALWRKENFLPLSEIQCPLSRFTGRSLLSTLTELSRLRHNHKLIRKWIFEIIVCKVVDRTEGDRSYGV
jgi:hypothetical protein